MKKIINMKWLWISMTMIFLLLLIGDVIYFKHTSRWEKNENNPYEIKVKPNDNFVFLGDSITFQYPLEEFYDDLPVINSGISGYTTSDILSHLDSMVTIYNPTKVFLLIGTNDIARGISEEQIYQNIQKIVSNILKKRPNTKIYIESIYPINNSDQEKINHGSVGIRTNKSIQTVNKKLKKYCSKKGYTYINLYDELKDSQGNIKLKYTQEGLHITPLGYLKITKTLYPYLKD